MLDVSRWRMPLFFSWFSQSLNPSSVPSAELRAPLCTWAIGHAGMLSAFLAPLHSLKIPIAGWTFAGCRGERCQLWYDFSSLRVFSRDLVWSHRCPRLGISILLFSILIDISVTVLLCYRPSTESAGPSQGGLKHRQHRRCRPELGDEAELRCSPATDTGAEDGVQLGQNLKTPGLCCSSRFRKS